MGGFNSHIFARRVSKRVAAADSSKQEAGVVDREHAAAEKPLNGFQVIPEHLVETIFLNLKKSSRRNQFAVCGVCKSWRSLGQRIFFDYPWASPQLICHPNQLFCLSPLPLPESRSGLLRCYVRRENCSNSKLRKISMWLGKGPSRTTTRFLMCAIQVGRCDNLLYLNSKGAGHHCARLSSNALATQYTLQLNELQLIGGDNEEQAQTIFAHLQYKARLKGFMQPRRMTVWLPDPSSYIFDASTLPQLAHVPHISNEEPEPSKSWRWLRRTNSVEVESAPSYSGHGEEVEETEDALPSGTGRAKRWLLGVKRIIKPSVDKNPLMFHDSAVALRNKDPHWNEALQCWCLNFRGRVKMASVKNFQLTVGEDATEKVAMQFGKVDASTFILDFNPTKLSAFQAFAVALTTFDVNYLISRLK